MARLVNRLSDQLLGDKNGLRMWGQRLAENLEAQLADIQTTLDIASASMSDVASITITADYTGAVDPSNQLPKTVNFYRYDGAVNVSASSAWTLTKTGGVTCTIGAATGVVTITALTSSGTITATAVHNGITLSRTINVTKSVAPAPTGGGGGGTVIFSKSSGFTNITSSSFVSITGVMTGTTPSGSTTVALAGTLSAHPLTGSTDTTIEMKFQRDIAGVWTDIGATFSSVSNLADGFDADVVLSASDTGLSGSTAYDWRIVGRRAAGTVSHTVSGQCTGTG